MLKGGAGSDYLIGGDGNDKLDGGLGTDAAEGGLGNDTYFLGSASDIALEAADEGVDLVQSSDFGIDLARYGAVENGIVLGSASVGLFGNALDNALSGTSGDNVIDGRTGADLMTGGLGNDTYIIDTFGDQVTELANGGTDSIQSSVTVSLRSGVTIEPIPGLDIVLNAMLNVENITLTGNQAIDAFGDQFVNSLKGNGAANLLDGGGGADKMTGGDGDDTYVVDDSQDEIFEFSGGGTDTVRSSVLGLDLTSVRFDGIENAELRGSLALFLTGDSGRNLLIGNSGSNRIDGGGGGDTMIGGAGNDTFVIKDGLFDEVIEEVSGGTDTVESATASLGLSSFANVENARLTGAANLSLAGNAGANTLIGNDGNNVLTGGGGSDRLTSGLGNDDFRYFSSGDSALSARDVITDFLAGSDDIDLSALATAPNSFTFRGTSAFAGSGQQVRFFQTKSTNSTTVEVDSNGDGSADMAITLLGLHTLTSSDFVFFVL